MPTVEISQCCIETFKDISPLVDVFPHLPCYKKYIINVLNVSNSQHYKLNKSFYFFSYIIRCPIVNMFGNVYPIYEIIK